MEERTSVPTGMSEVTRIVVGRNNLIHLGSGRAEVVLFSAVQGCRALGLKPFAYLRELIDRVSIRQMSPVAGTNGSDPPGM